MKSMVRYLFFIGVMIFSKLSHSAVFTVTSLDDSGPGTLREALSLAFTGDQINFSVSGTINLNSDLPSIIGGITIDARGTGNVPTIVLRRAGDPGGTGFNIQAEDAVIIRGFVFQNFATGIYFNSAYTNYDTKIQCNYFGTNLNGTLRENPISFYGIEVYSSTYNLLIGGSQDRDKNIFGGVGFGATSLSGNPGGAISIYNYQENITIEGNNIGTDVTGNAGLTIGNNFDSFPDGTNGIYIENTYSGGGWFASPSVPANPPVVVKNNLISSSLGNGIKIIYSSDVIVTGNKIGTNLAGTSKLGNGKAGIYVNESDNTYIGGYVSGNSNLISGSENGINIEYSNETHVINNLIGVNASGAVVAGLGNFDYGVLILESSYSYIEGNVIAGNSSAGIYLYQISVAAENSFLQNSIFCNEGGGILVENGANNDYFNYAPTIKGAFSSQIKGTASPGDRIDVFIVDETCNEFGIQGKVFKGFTYADGLGEWVLHGSFPPNAKVTATATQAVYVWWIGGYDYRSTSPFSLEETVINCSAYSVNAGEDQLLCITANSVTLAGSFTGGTAVEWSTYGWGTVGNGVYSNQTSTNTTYTFTQDDKYSREINFILKLTGNGICPDISDTLMVLLEDTISVNAGFDRESCANTPIDLSGSVGGWIAVDDNPWVKLGFAKEDKDPTGSAFWSTTGTGTFENALGLYSSYFPSAADTAKGSVTFILTAIQQVCPVGKKDTVIYTFIKTPIVNAGIDTVVCKFASNFPLNGSAIMTSNYSWSTLGTGSFTNPTSLQATYTPSAIDKALGLRLILTSISNSDCPSSRDTMWVTFSESAAVDAGPVQVVCQGDTLHLMGYAANTTGLTWTTNGTGQFLGSVNAVNVSYVPSANDYTKVVISFTLSAAASGLCVSYSDVAISVIVPPPSPGIPSSFQICPDSEITLNASQPVGAQVGVWSVVQGSGTFQNPTSGSTLVTNVGDNQNIYKYTLVDTQTGCSNSVDYKVFRCYEPDLIVYNAVSPNNDGKNEVFEIENIDAYKNNKVLIYNRWGDLVYEENGYDNFEKVFRGYGNIDSEKELPDGVYYYVIIKGNGKSEKGFLVLKK